MSVIENLTRQVKAGDTLKPWIMLGPFNLDSSDKVVGLSYFETAGTQAGRTAMNGIVDEALKILGTAPKEGQTGCFLGKETRWDLQRGPEEYLSWGTYNIKNHLGAAFLSTIITPYHPGMQQWRLTARIRERAIVCINSVVVFDSANVSEDFGYGGNTHEFQAPLRAGENIVNVGLFRLARMAQVGMRLEIMDGDVTTCVPRAPGIPQDARARVEQELAGLRLARDVFYPEQGVSVELGHAPDSGFKLRVELLTNERQALRTAEPTAVGTIKLAAGSELADGVYHLRFEWLDHNDQPLTTTVFENLHKVTPVIAPQGYDKIDERRRMVLEHYADNIEGGQGSDLDAGRALCARTIRARGRERDSLDMRVYRGEQRLRRFHYPRDSAPDVLGTRAAPPQSRNQRANERHGIGIQILG